MTPGLYSSTKKCEYKQRLERSRPGHWVYIEKSSEVGAQGSGCVRTSCLQEVLRYIRSLGATVPCIQGRHTLIITKRVRSSFKTLFRVQRMQKCMLAIQRLSNRSIVYNDDIQNHLSPASQTLATRRLTVLCRLFQQNLSVFTCDCFLAIIFSYDTYADVWSCF